MVVRGFVCYHYLEIILTDTRPVYKRALGLLINLFALELNAQWASRLPVTSWQTVLGDIRWSEAHAAG
jgi:hypothetical protein